ncbi:VOC family protein [Brevundimonas sp. Root1279]|uniref:VOC family protein n=1 Tax=Brevundimonas sp. Root1279 TaxID=1736443 RepID=UPI0006F309BE|nr:VOC family protein [Brevundimonas sp. Root1279]KQW86327.1 glyoxalase [Brevundimonas sp. Root1279]
MTVPPLLAAEPQLFVTDLARARAFYEDQLGLSLAFAYGEPAFYAQVVRDGARLNLRLVEGPVSDAAFLARHPEPLTATVTLNDAEPLFCEYEARGVAFHAPVRTEAWGARTFMVRDPDGNLLLFAGQGG